MKEAYCKMTPRLLSYLSVETFKFVKFEEMQASTSDKQVSGDFSGTRCVRDLTTLHKAFRLLVNLSLGALP